MGIFSVVSYRPYFNVDTSDVLDRIKDSLFPFRGDFVEKTSHNPDMFVLETTVHLTLAACQVNLSSNLHKLVNWRFVCALSFQSLLIAALITLFFYINPGEVCMHQRLRQIWNRQFLINCLPEYMLGGC